MKIMVLIVLLLYALVMLAASLLARRLGLAGALLGLWVCALLNGRWLFGRIQPGHLLVRGGLSLVLWLAYTLV